jgi:choline-sulfatase
MFDRREFLELAASAMLGGTSANVHSESGANGTPSEAGQVGNNAGKLKSRPNIILFMPDEMRADSLGCFGNEVCKTPNFDRLSSEGTRFSNCHVQFPACGASRCSLLTGWPTSVRGHRSLYYFLRPEEPNLFRYLRQAGYDVFWFGKNDALAAQCFADSVTQWAEPDMAVLRGSMQVSDVTPGSFSMLLTAGGERRESPDYQMLARAFEILERKETDRPFCIFLPLLEPHPPYTVPEDFYNMYSASDLPPLAPSGLPNKPAFHAGIRELYNLAKVDDATLRKVRAVYYGQVSYSDWLMGELMEALARTGHSGDTALFLLSDHGDYAGDYGLVEKWPSGLEDCLTHVPMIGRVPGGKPGIVADDMTELYDVMATCLDLAGAEANHTHFARSLTSQLAGGKGDPDRAAFSESGYNVYEPQCFEPLGAGGGLYAGKIRLQNERPETVARSSMVRTRTHKLIRRPHGENELYDNQHDPQERNNLFGERSVADIQASLERKLLDHFINTTGIAPTDKDPRSLPPYYPTKSDLTPPNWQSKVLDK